MAFDIYGNILRNGYCEVHPNVHEEYPCALCLSNDRNRNQQKHMNNLRIPTPSQLKAESAMPDVLTLSEALQFANEFMETFPMCHLCGSLALYLHGFKDLRNQYYKDLDFNATATMPPIEDKFENANDGSPDDFDSFVVKKSGKNVAIEVSINPASEFENIVLNGVNYRVAKLREIIAWKKYYADKGVEKHKNDLIKMGIIPAPVVTTYEDGLPF